MWILAIIALMVLGADVAVHVLATAGVNVQEWVGPFWVEMVLFWGVLVGMLAAAGIAEKLWKWRRRERGVAIVEEENPWWFKVVMVGVILYAAVNVVGLVLIGGEIGELSEPTVGVYMLDTGHGRPVREITREEYDRYQRNNVRAATAFCLMMYLQMALDMVWLARGKVRMEGKGKAGAWMLMVWRRRRIEDLK